MALLDRDHATADLWRRALVAELAWLDGTTPRACAIVPLERDGTLCAAVPYHRYTEVASLADGAAVSWSVTDPHGRGEAPGLRVTGRVEVVDDLDGVRFVDELLELELRRHPPTRLRSDSPMQRREQWWWLPRRIVTLGAVDTVAALSRRTSDADGVLVTASTSGGVEVTTVAVRPFDEAGGHERPTPVSLDELDPDRHEVPVVDDTLVLTALDGGAVRGAAESALLFGHDYIVPDLSRWQPWYRRGRLRGAHLSVDEAVGAPGVGAGPARLRDRLRDEANVRLGCRRGLRRARADGQRARSDAGG